MCALKRWIEPSSSLMATTPRQRPSSSTITSMAKNSMKNSAAWRSAWPYIVCSIAWPVRSAAAQVRCAGVRAGREYLGAASGLQPGLAAAHHRAQARSAGADHDHVVAVIFDRIGAAVEGRSLAIRSAVASHASHLEAEHQDGKARRQ